MANACASSTRSCIQLGGHFGSIGLAIALASAAHLAAPQLAASAQAQESPANGAVSKNDYTDQKNWLCRPGRQDACTIDLTATVIAADGRLTRETWVADPKAAIDCFYVYPTVSNEPTANSSMAVGPEEVNIVAMQFARFGSKCQLYAPLYRQETRATVRARTAGQGMAAVADLAYNDVLDAWNAYVAHDNRGRGVVLIGHSQGSRWLVRLIKDEIDGKPMQSRLVSALLMGTNLPVPRGKDVGGVFQHIPLCRAPRQTGCVVTYVSFRATAPPPANTLFGTVHGPLDQRADTSLVAACTNPAALGGGSGTLRGYFATHGEWTPAGRLEVVPAAWVKPPPTIATPFVSLPGMVTAECVSNDHGSYLAISVHGDTAGGRVATIGGDLMRNNAVLPEWGLHLIDVNEALGNLVDIVGQQAASYRARPTSP